VIGASAAFASSSSKLSFQLGNLRIELLGGATELHSLQLRQLQLHLLDQHIARMELRR
jgi:hypothetical protein